MKPAPTVTLLVPDGERDKANGLVGAVQGVAFMTTSVFSGLSIGLLGMGWTLAIAIALTAVALADLLLWVRILESGVFHDPESGRQQIDLRGSLAAIRAVPGLLALIFYTAFNNVIGGVYLALMDPYGLTLILGRDVGDRAGRHRLRLHHRRHRHLAHRPGRQPGAHAAARQRRDLAARCAVRHPRVVVAVCGRHFVFMCLMPAAEAAEQTIIQRLVLLHRQGRVFGFAQTVETAASPVTSFVIGLLAQFWIILLMNSDDGRVTFGWLLGDGRARGIALVFVLASTLMLITVLVALRTSAYRRLSAYAERPAAEQPS